MPPRGGERARSWLLAAAALCACDHAEPVARTPEGARRAPVTSTGAQSSARDEESKRSVTVVSAPAPATPTEAPQVTSACIAGPAFPLHPRTTHPSVAWDGAAARWAAITSTHPAALHWGRLVPDSAAQGGWRETELRSHPLDGPHRADRARSGLLRIGEQWHIAYIESHGALSLLRPPETLDGVAAPRVLAADADGRFPPVGSSHHGGALLAYVVRGSPMRTRVLVLDAHGAVRARHWAGGEHAAATAPVFVSGAPLALLVVDARDGFSPISQISFLPDGTPGAPEVLRTVGTSPTPPQLAAVRTGPATLAIGYTAISQSATSAIGLVLTPGHAAPAALVPGRGHGALSVVAAGALFAVTVPTGPGAHAPRSIQLRAPNAPAAMIFEAPPPARHPALTADERGDYFLAYATDTHTVGIALRCGAPPIDQRASANEHP